MEKSFFNLSDNVNMLSIVGAVVIVLVTMFVAGKYIKQMRDDEAKGELAENNWDGVQEYKNPLPIGWAVMFIVLIVWAVWYMFLGYPLGQYSQIGEYNEEVQAYNNKFESEWSNPSKEVLKEMGEGVFLVQCAPCHGITADGINGKAADLTQWGTEEAIYNTIINGSKGLGFEIPNMPEKVVNKEDAKAVAAYVAKEVSAIKHTNNPNLVAKGKELWYNCAACHGEDGKGMNKMAPDLTTYGGADFVVSVLNHGKNGFIGKMPNFNNGLLTQVQKKAVGTFVTSLPAMSK